MFDRGFFLYIENQRIYESTGRVQLRQQFIYDLPILQNRCVSPFVFRLFALLMGKICCDPGLDIQMMPMACSLLKPLCQKL